MKINKISLQHNLYMQATFEVECRATYLEHYSPTVQLGSHVDVHLHSPVPTHKRKDALSSS